MSKLKFPARTTIKTRAGHLNNAFYQTAFPFEYPTDTQIEDMYYQLNIKENECVYCGRKINKLDADHLHPIQNRQDPKTIYCTDISNIVPCCSECNNKKGNLPFLEFYTDPKTKEYLFGCGLSLKDYMDKLKRISEYDDKSKFLKIDDEDLELKDDVLAIKDAFCNLLSRFSIWWGNEIKRKNGKETSPVDDREQFTEQDMEIIQKIGEILGGDLKKRKIKIKPDEKGLW